MTSSIPLTLLTADIEISDQYGRDQRITVGIFNDSDDIARAKEAVNHRFRHTRVWFNEAEIDIGRCYVPMPDELVMYKGPDPKQTVLIRISATITTNIGKPNV
jgi:hypothetical protein